MKIFRRKRDNLIQLSLSHTKKPSKTILNYFSFLLIAYNEYDYTYTVLAHETALKI